MTDTKGLVSLVIEDQIFKVKKELLCENSDYFQAMFSGNYVENVKAEVVIDMIGANSMKSIIEYMDKGSLDLSDYSLSRLGVLASAATFLQVTGLLKLIENALYLQIQPSNWFETMRIAEKCACKNLDEITIYGLVSFYSMKPEHIPNIANLYWYLSNSYLKADNEVDVFRFGFEWVSHHKLDTDTLLVILYCLDTSRLSLQDLEELRAILYDKLNCLASKVITCMYNFCSKGHELTVENIEDSREYLIQNFTENVYYELSQIVKENKRRLLQLTPIVPMSIVKDIKAEVSPHFLYTYVEKHGFSKWLEVAEKSLWGWGVVAWGSTKLVVACGEHGRGTGVFMRDIKVYDTLKDEWLHHQVELPPRRHAGLAVLGDSLYIVGGVGSFRVLLCTAIVYDLKKKSFRKIAKLTDAIQNPAVCTHKGKVYAASHKSICEHEDLEESNRWLTVVGTEIRFNCLVSYKEHIYCTQNYFVQLYRFQPGCDQSFEMVTVFSSPPTAICNTGNKLIVFIETASDNSDCIGIEEYQENRDKKPRVLCTTTDAELKVNDAAGSCSLLIKAPPLDNKIPEHHMIFLKRYITD